MQASKNKKHHNLMIRTYDNRQAPLKTPQTGSVHNVLIFLVVLAFGLFFGFRYLQDHVSAATSKITSGVSGYCLDDHKDIVTNSAVVDDWGCNGTSAQDWVATDTTITHDDKYCLSVQDNSTDKEANVTLDSCNGAPGQVWLRDQTGYQNPNSGLCLSTSPSQTDGHLFLDSCSNLSSQQETWSPVSLSDKSGKDSITCSGSEDEKVACYAVKEWTSWQSGTISHENLLNSYTDGAPYEEWCADFVSYVYKEAGYPFTQGETNGWDENIAGNIQNQGDFTMHSASSGYVPHAGDVAFFDYPGGHVEIVVSGGKTPTFVYGDSATIDPSTGNGDMEANTITSEPNLGQLTYYLSPN